MNQPFYITTPIYYVNDVPHLGHAYTTIVADALARFHRMRGDDTRFLTGTDEHGQKIEEAAGKRGLTPHQLVDQVAPRFAEVWQTLGISNDDFIRTTEPRHKQIVAELWKRISSAGDLYLASYQGWYCVGCEAFYTESQLLKDGDAWVCTIHKRPVNWVDKERSWFFRLSKFAAPLIEHIERHPEFIQPEAYRNEVMSFLKGGLKDLSVSRTSFQWGIPVPEADPDGLSHVIYVWLDALTNYLSALCDNGVLDGPLVEKFWSSAIHLIGKDILRFHAVYWPAFLMSAHLPLPKTILAHGWWTVRGEKISKSIPATRIDPLTLSVGLGSLSQFGLPIGIDAMRYYLLREIPLGNDGDFTFESLFGRYNAELANDLGNLINRSLALITKFAAETPPTFDVRFHGDGTDHPSLQLEALAVEVSRNAARDFSAAAPSRALEQVWRLVGGANRFIDQTQPWAMAKAKNPALGHTLWTLQASLWLIGRLVAPVLPATSSHLRAWLGDLGPLAWPEPINGRILTTAPPLVASIPVPLVPLFPRLDDKAQAVILAQILPGETLSSETRSVAEIRSPPVAEIRSPPEREEPITGQHSANAKAGDVAPPSTVDMEDFKKIDLRAGRVLAAQAVPKAKKLVHLTVDLGEASPRSIVAGIAEKYAPAELIGRQVLVVANLAPATIRGVRSEGMILAAGDDAILGLSALDQDVPPGTRVR